MIIRLLSVGRDKDEYKKLIDEYTTRVNRLINIERLTIAPSGKPGLLARKDESAEILAKIKPNSVVWLLHETGEQIESPALASKLNVMQHQAVQDWVIVVGGAYGVDESLKKRANFVWSLSKMVFPHRLAQLMVVEQLYRATEINRGSQYHHV